MKLRNTQTKVIITITPTIPLFKSVEKNENKFNLIFDENNEPIKTRTMNNVDISVDIFLIIVIFFF